MSYDTVECLECGSMFSQLTQHLRVKHGMTVEEYRQKHGDVPVWSQKCLDRPSPMKGRKHPSRDKIIQNLKNTKGTRKGTKIGVSGLPVYKMGEYLAVWHDGRNVYEHRYIMEKKVGRKLLRSEHVHHIDGNKLNNEESNLELINGRDHCSQHMKENRSNGTINNEHFKGLKNNPYGRAGKPK